MRRRSPSVGACVVLVFLNACASAPPTRSFAEVPGRIDIGTRVVVITTDGEAAAGKVAGLHDQALSIVSDDALREYPAGRIGRITRKKRHVAAGTLIGLGAGAAVGVLSASSVDSTGTPIDAIASAASLAVGVLLGTAAGAVIGALVQTNRTVYLAPASPP